MSDDVGLQVWVVESGIYDYRMILGVYGTSESAKADNPIPAHATPMRGHLAEWQVDKHGRWWNGLDDSWSVEITPYVVEP